MIKNGTYKVLFSALIPGEGGTVTVRDGAVHGGDTQYKYDGDVSGDVGRLSALIRVTPKTASAQSVFKTIGEDFTLHLKGNLIGDGFQLSGAGPGASHAIITISGTWIGPLPA